MIYPHNQPNVYLFDNCGQVVHTWEDNADSRAGNTAYLLEDGRLLKTKRPANFTGDPIWAGGGGASVEIRSWENELLWSFTLNDSLRRLHHDIEYMPNGHVLMIVWELKTQEEAIAAGRDSNLLSQGVLWPDYIIEVDPQSDEIVWEWHTWDHLIQDFDSTKENFGTVSEHPELIDLNLVGNDGRADWMHTNAIDYHPALDQIMLSVPTLNEVWIIDHTTTTEQAAGHSGGLGNRGGDLLYRWGNPAAYRAGTTEDQTLFFQHDAHWALDFLENSHPHFGKIAVFNNRFSEDFSTANVFNPPFDMYKWTYLMEGTVWGPSGYDLAIEHPEPAMLHSTGMSSVQLLPNGNTLICSGKWGYTFELTPERHIVWEYATPPKAGLFATQSDTLVINDNLTFRLKRYPLDYGAFDGKELVPAGYIELNPDTTYCDEVLSATVDVHSYHLKVFPNPAAHYVTFEWEKGKGIEFDIYNVVGHLVSSMEGSGGRKYLDITLWDEGVYFIRINNREVAKLIVAR
jgi:hypothetical protein